MLTKIIFILASISVSATDVTMPPAESMLDHEVETGSCKGTTLSTCADFTSPEGCLLMGCSAIFPPHTLPTHREMCFCTDEMKDCSDFDTNYECEFLAGCDWEYDFVFGESSDSGTEAPTDGSRGLDFGVPETEVPTDGSRGIYFGDDDYGTGFFSVSPTSSPSSSPTSSPSSSPTSQSSETSESEISERSISDLSESNSSVGKMSGLTFVLFLIPCYAFLL